MSSNSLYDARRAAKPEPCYRIDPETGERLERVVRKRKRQQDGTWERLPGDTSVREVDWDALRAAKRNGTAFGV